LALHDVIIMFSVETRRGLLTSHELTAHETLFLFR